MVKALPDPADFDMPDAQPWDRRPGEPTKAYAAFRIYRDLPAAQRDFERTAEQAGVVGRSTRRWASAWDWHERADAWDDACHQIDDQERLEAIRAMHGLHRKAGRAAVGKAMQALQILSPEQMADSPSIIARLLELGTKLERSTLIVSVEELQGIEVEEEGTEDPWERIARELDPNAIN